MKLNIRTGLLGAAMLLGVASQALGISLQLSVSSTAQSSSPIEADYSTSHIFVDEVNGDSIPITIFFNTGTNGVDEAEVFTNLNNRDQANVTSGNGNVPNETGVAGIPYGIIPPNGGYILTTTTNSYYSAYQMTPVSGGYLITLHANKCGAYRITARYHLSSDPALTGTAANTWHYYDDFKDGNNVNFRDAAIVVSPTKARTMTMYEVNAMYVDAEAPANDNDASTRSTFDYFDGGPNCPPSKRPFDLNYVKSLGVNWLWLQPIHPVGIQGRQSDPNEGNAAFSVGSPYSVKNFFAVNSLFSKTFVSGSTSEATGRANAMIEWKNFVKVADTAGVNVMLDVPFNHTSFDCEMDTIGGTLFNTSGTNLMENTQANIFSRWNGESVSGADQTSGNYLQYFDYGARAYDAGSIALACDRDDFGKFIDVHDIYFGSYAALVELDQASEQSNYLSQQEWFDYSIGAGGVSNDALDASTNSNSGHFDTVTQNMWKYFAWYIPYWLQQTGHTDSNGNLVGNSTLSDPVMRRTADDLGLDGIRADFAQGLPPQLWEYIVNYARSYKWDFLFMAESLDGGNVTYRSNRHFDIVNENVLFDLYNAQATQDFRNIYDGRRSSYGQGLVLWDTESHDEAGYTDPYQALIRYAVNSTIDGVPEIFYGQEIGISGQTMVGTSATTAPFGFSAYQVNFGKGIPNFMCFNSLANAWNNLGSDAFGQAQLYPVYSAIAKARLSSPALQSSNRFYLNDMNNNVPSNIFGVAKYQTANANPNVSDVVLAFVNLSESATSSNVFNVNVTQNGSNLFGILANRTYNIKNIAADLEYDNTRASTYIWGSAGISGSSILNNGVFVGLNPVPSGTSAWPTAPYEAQYLKLYDITPPPAPAAPVTKGYSVGGTTTFTWSPASDPGGVSGYIVVVSTAPNGGGTVLYSGTVTTNSVAVTGGTIGQQLYAKITQVNGAGVTGSASSTSGSGTVVLDPNGDQNGVGQTNAQQDAAGFNPLTANNYFHITSVVTSGSGTQVTWSSVPGRTYLVQTSASPTSGFVALSGTITTGSASTSYTDTAAVIAKRFYQVTTPYQPQP